MRHSLLSGIFALALLIIGTGAIAASVVAEGSAPIHNGNLSLAREEAIRNALAEAARLTSVTVDAALGISGGQVAFDQVVVKSAANVFRHQVISEQHDESLYRVTISADLESAAGRAADNYCRSGYTKRLLIGGFPMLRPEQLEMEEMSGYAHLTAREIAKRFGATPAVFVDHNGSLMLHFGVPERVIGDTPPDAQAWTLGRAEAEKHRAQYLLIGRYHSLALSPNKSKREIDIEALIIDASSGSCVARKRFYGTASGRILFPSLIIPASTPFGSAAHYATDFGKPYGEILTDIARWADATTSCQPFSARVVKVDGKSVYFDVGAEQGVSIGDIFSTFKPASKPVTARGGEILGIEKKTVGDLKVTTTYPRFSIGELTPPFSGMALERGDELFSH